MKLSAFIALLPALSALNAERLPYKYGLPFSILLKETQDKVKSYEEASRAAAEEFADRDESGKMIELRGGVRISKRMKEYDAAMAELGEVEVDIVLPTIPSEVLNQVDERHGLFIPPQLLRQLLDVVIVRSPPAAKPADTPSAAPAAKP